MRIAIAHDYLTQLGGAERVVLSLMKAFPGAPVHTTLYAPDSTFPQFRDADIRVSPLNRIPLVRNNHRAALPVLAPVSDRVRIDADVVVASSSGWAHGFPTSGKKLVYCHSPARWLYLADEYLGDRAGLLRPALDALTPPLRRWDQRAAASADRYLANSRVVQRRIQQLYGRDADVLHPPHTVDLRGAQEPVARVAQWPDFHLLVSRLLPYKNVERAVEAFAQLPNEQLVIVGRGPLAARLQDRLGARCVLLQGVPETQLRWLYAHAKALIAPSYEDFGLTVVEAAAFGTPTLALHAGGYLDTVVDGVSGYFFEDPSAGAIATAVRRLAERPLSRTVVADHAQQFSEELFIESIRTAVAQLEQSVARRR
ncbi:glycosyltransferase [Calidifontibacter terrae]